MRKARGRRAWAESLFVNYAANYVENWKKRNHVAAERDRCAR